MAVFSKSRYEVRLREGNQDLKIGLWRGLMKLIPLTDDDL